MAKSNRTRRTRKAQSHHSKGPIAHVPGKGLVVSTTGRFPQSASDKLVCAKSIIQAVVAAEDTGALVDENYDLHWPLSVAVELLEQADRQINAAGVPS